MMAISFEQMPEANKQKALDIFGRQQRGEITQAQAEREARENERAAQQAVASTTTGGGAAGGTSAGGRIPKPPSTEKFKPGAAGDEAACGPRPNTVVPPGQRLVCNRQTRQWELVGPDPYTRVPGGGALEAVPVEEIPETPLPDMQAGMMEAQRQSAKAIIDSLLADYDLAGLTDFVNDLIFKEDILDARAILARIRTDKGAAGEIYWNRFAGNRARRQAGFNLISEAEYVALENSYRQVMRASGLPTGFYDAPDDFSALIGGDVSVAELSARVNEGYLAVQQSNPQVINEMRRLYGVDDSMLAAYFLDPAKATPMLLRQARSAQIASEATLQAEQQISAMTAEELAVAGITQQQARAGFQTIAQAEELFVPLPGTTEQAITQEEQIAGVFGTSAAAQQRIRQRSRERQAAFQAGGTFAGQGSTVTGLQ
jgi:hypothetical protein